MPITLSAVAATSDGSAAGSEQTATASAPIDERHLVVDPRPDLAGLHEHLAACEAEVQLRVLRERQRRQHPLLVDRGEPAGEIAGARHVLGPLAHQQPPHLRPLRAEACSLLVDGIEPETLEQNVRRRVVGEREHQQRAVGERQRAGERSATDQAAGGTSTRLVRVEAGPPERRGDEELDRRRRRDDAVAALLAAV